MLTKLTIIKFKRFEKAEIELGNPVVFIGPNNSGKTSALQALALWDVGLKRWNEKRKSKTSPQKRSPTKRPGVTVSRRDLIAVPVPNASLLWRDLHVRDAEITDGKQVTSNVRIEIIIEGVTQDKSWKCGLEFDYANEESFYCRPLRLSNGKNPERMPIPEEAEKVRVAFLPPMSGLAANETRLDSGAINVRIGEGRTAEVLRNLCFKIAGEDVNQSKKWRQIVDNIDKLFGVQLDPPEYISERGEIVMTYRERDKRLDLSSSGRGLQQTLLLLAYMYANPGSVLLLDEPDAHLEILRQRQIYQLLSDVANENGNQIIAASHSEILLNEAADRDVVIAFLGKPHRINDRGSQVLKALKEIGFEHYYQAEQTGWVLYLEGSTDLAILRAFAKRMALADGITALERPFVHYVGNQPMEVSRHFYGVREAVPHLRGIAIFDRLEQDLPADLETQSLTTLIWKRREIENYLCYPETLEAYAQASTPQEVGPLFTKAESQRRLKVMRNSINEISVAMEKLEKGSPWDSDTKVSDDFLVLVFKAYFKKLNLPNLMDKKNFDELVPFVPEIKIAPEIVEKLNAIVKIAKASKASKTM